MESSLLLENFLDVLPKSALILTSHGQQLSGGSLKVCYANPAFLDILGDDSRLEGDDSLTSMLEAKCVHPTMPRFIKWIDTVLQNPDARHGLRTSFQGNETVGHGPAAAHQKILDIKWKAFVLKEKYVVLTGKTTGAASYFTGGAGPVVTRPTLLRMPSAASTHSTDSTESPHAIRAISPGSPTSFPVGPLSDSSPSYFTEAFTEGTSPKGLHPWRHRERVLKPLIGGGVMGAILRAKDWGKTKWGPMEAWPPSLLSMVSLLIHSTSPMALWYGKEHLVIYNDGYIPVAGKKHPSCFGESAAEYWGEAWPRMESVFTGVMNGESVNTEDSCVFVDRETYIEETYLTWSYAPWRGEDGAVAGFLNPCFESTGRVIADRRLRTLGELDTCIASAATMNDLGNSISKAFTFNAYDIPFALVYFCSVDYGTRFEDGLERRSTSESEFSEPETSSLRVTYTLQSTVGIPKEHTLAPRTVDHTTSDNYVWPFRKMAKEHTQINVTLSNELDGIQHQGWPDLPTSAVAVPIFGARESSGKPIMTGMLIMGLNPRRVFDNDYLSWIRICSRHIAAAMNVMRGLENAARKAEDLAAQNRNRTDFLNTVSHELRTPLTLILGPLDECIDDPSLVQAHRKRLTLVRRNARRLLRLVNSLLDLSRLEAGKMSAAFRETSLQRYTTDLASLFRSAIEKGGVKFEVTMDGKDIPVWIDREMWEKIVFNVIGNAFKFTLSGKITIRCSASADEHHMLFTVQDTGIGIPAHEVHRIFENFHRAHNQKGRSFEGTGMGLALTQQLVTLHGGHMEVESTFGQGTTFIIYVLVGNSHLPKSQLVEGEANGNAEYGQGIVDEAERWANVPDLLLPDVSTSSSDSGNAFTVVVPPSSRGCRILVADDNEDMRYFLRGVLRQYYQVLEASNGQMAFEMAIEEQPDLILSDIMMPGLDGYGLLKVLRSSPTTRAIPFVLLSANAGDKARIEGLVAGADDYLAKPFSAKELIARVHTLLDNSRMRIALEKRVKEVSKDLSESEERFRLLSVMSPIGIARISRSGQVIYGNPKWIEMSRGDDFLELAHPDDKLQLSLENADHFSFEVRWGTVDHFVWVMGELVPEIVADEHRGFIVVLTDVTDRREAESARLQAVEDARAREGLAIDIICHELRNPLNGIYNNAEIVYENLVKLRDDVSLLGLGIGDDLARDLDSMEALVHCAKHQNRIVDDVLQLGKLSMNLISIRKTPFDPLIEVKTCVQRTSAEGIEISGKSGWVSGDPIRYSQILLNLLSNAIRFARNVQVVFHTASSILTTSVIDNGIGMDIDQLSALMHSLERASPRTYVEYGGSGLGLFISKTLVEAHGGKLSIESRKHKGTTASFTISVEELTKAIQPVPLSRPPTSIHVLIVEDNLINQQVLTRQLQLAGFQTTVANHGAECLELLDGSFNIILMDVEMPVMDGIQAAVEIRRREGDGKHIPIIAVTGNARIEQIERALSVGMDHVITKPYSRKDLVDRIQELLS